MQPTRRAATLLAVAAVALLVAGGLALASRRGPTPLRRAQAVAADVGRFDSGRRAGDALAEISALVEDDARRCTGDDAPRGTTDDEPGCQARYAFAGWTRVAAAGALRCTAPGRADLRAAVVGHLDVLAELAPDDAAPPPLPPLPDCATLGRRPRP